MKNAATCGCSLLKGGRPPICAKKSSPRMVSPRSCQSDKSTTEPDGDGQLRLAALPTLQLRRLLASHPDLPESDDVCNWRMLQTQPYAGIGGFASDSGSFSVNAARVVPRFDSTTRPASSAACEEAGHKDDMPRRTENDKDRLQGCRRVRL